MKKLKVIQIGTEHDHAAEAFKTLRAREELFDVIGFCMPEDDTNVLYEKRKDVYAGTRLFTLDEALNGGADAVVIETSDKLLTKYARTFVDKGIPVQMDKPGSADGDEFDAMIDAAAEKKLPIQLGYMYRFNPEILRLYDRIEKGELGEILYINAEMNCWHKPEKRQWLADYPAGMLYFLGCHLIDVIYKLQGEPLEVVPLSVKSGLDGTDGYDVGFAAFRYAHGTSFARSTAVERGGFKRRQIVVVGSKGTCEINPTEYHAYSNQYKDMLTNTRYVFTTGWGDDAEHVPGEPYHRYDDMFRSFYDIATGKKQNPYSYEYEKGLHRLILKACGVK